MHALVLSLALARPVQIACKQYAERVTRDAGKDLSAVQAAEILKANRIENSVCHSTAIDQATLLIIARAGLRLLKDAEEMQTVHLRSGM